MKSLALATAVAAAALVFGSPSHAMPVVQPAGVSSGIVQVAEGCGPGFHRVGPYGRCVPNFRPPFRACPPGMHLDRFGHCRPNY